MPKLLLQVLVACSIWFGLAALGAPRAARLLLIGLGFAAVHLVWQRLFPDGFSAGSMAVADDDPLMVDALQHARTTMPEFLRLYPDHATDSIIKFRLVTDQGVTESVWADLLSMSDGAAKVYVRTAPVHHTGSFEPMRTIAVADFIDWQIEFRDGTLRGGFTNLALFKAFQRENGNLPADVVPHLSRFRDLGPDDYRKGA